MNWRAVIFGPEGTVWDGGTAHLRGCRNVQLQTLCSTGCNLPPTTGVFLLTLAFSEDYPNKAPIVKFKTPMYHPNSACGGCGRPLSTWQADHRPSESEQPPSCAPNAVYADGSICLDILQNQWSPIYDVSAILTSIQVYDRGGDCNGQGEGAAWRIPAPEISPCMERQASSLAPPFIHSLQSLLSDPNPNSPANSEAAKLFVEDR